MKLTAIEIKNFKCIKALKLEKIQDLSFFIGNNGSGKSALFAALRFLRDCVVDGDIRKVLERFNGFDDLLFRGASEDKISIKVKLTDLKNGGNCFSYTLTIRKVAGELSLKEVLKGSRNLRFINYCAGNGFIQDAQKEYSPIAKTRVALSVFGSIAKYKNIATFKDYIASWFFAGIDLAKARKGAGSVLPAYRLKEDASNLCNVLLAIQENAPDVMEDTVKELEYIAPDLSNMSISKDSGELRLQLSFKPYNNSPFSINSISDGTLMYIAYIVLTKQLSSVSLLFLDNPECHMFSETLVFLHETLLANAASTQTFIITHSPELLRYVDLKHVNLVVKEGASTVIYKLTANKELYAYLRTTTLMQAWQDRSLFALPNTAI